jgi:hypothetical protein
MIIRHVWGKQEQPFEWWWHVVKFGWRVAISLRGMFDRDDWKRYTRPVFWHTLRTGWVGYKVRRRNLRKDGKTIRSE